VVTNTYGSLSIVVAVSARDVRGSGSFKNNGISGVLGDTDTTSTDVSCTLIVCVVIFWSCMFIWTVSLYTTASNVRFSCSPVNPSGRAETPAIRHVMQRRANMKRNIWFNNPGLFISFNSTTHSEMNCPHSIND
jgi:hypothetical protein